jgi:rare lipoprotein A
LADESRALKAALLRGTPSAENVQIAAAPRAAVTSDALPPPPGARSSAAGVSVLPPPSETMPTAAPAAGQSKGRTIQRPVARPAEPVIVQPDPARPVSVHVAQPHRPASRTADSVVTETAALPVPQQAAATAHVTMNPVEPTSLFIQAGAFANYDNAYRMSVRLSRYGGTKVTPVNTGTQQLYRVRLGPIPSVQEADLLLAEVTPVVPEARIVVD